MLYTHNKLSMTINMRNHHSIRFTQGQDTFHYPLCEQLHTSCVRFNPDSLVVTEMAALSPPSTQ